MRLERLLPFINRLSRVAGFGFRGEGNPYMHAHAPGGAASAGSRRLRCCPAIAVGVFLCGCSMDRGARLEQRVGRLEEDRSLNGDPAAQERERRIEEEIAALEVRLNELRDAVQRSSMDGSGRYEKLAEEVGQLRASTEATSRRLDASEASIAQLRSSVATRPPERSASRTAELNAPVPTHSARPTRPVVASEAPQHPTGTPSVLALAQEQEGKGDKAAARELYEEYVKDFPTDPNAAQAHYRLGEIAFGERRFPDALLEFGKVAKDFPGSGDAPNALVRAADSMLALNMKDDALVVLKEVPRRYPESSAAARARQRLTSLAGSDAPTGRGTK